MDFLHRHSDLFHGVKYFHSSLEFSTMCSRAWKRNFTHIPKNFLTFTAWTVKIGIAWNLDKPPSRMKGHKWPGHLALSSALLLYLRRSPKDMWMFVFDGIPWRHSIYEVFFFCPILYEQLNSNANLIFTVIKIYMHQVFTLLSVFC